LHTPVQLPPEQTGLAIWFDEQAALQAPQCATLLDRFSSQPVVGFPSQSARLAAQTHAPVLHRSPTSALQSVPASHPEPSALHTAARVPSQPGWFGVHTPARQVVLASSQYSVVRHV
jgi:hypothetical protein